MTSIIPDQPTNGLAETTAQTVAAIHARADGLRSIAAFIAGNPDLPGIAAVTPLDHIVLVPLSGRIDPTNTMTAWMTRAISVGARVVRFRRDGDAGINLYFGASCIQMYARCEQVGEIEIPAHARREQAEAVNV